MTVYTPTELDALHYADAAGEELTDRYYPKELRRPAYDTMIALSKLAIVINKQPNPAETWTEYGETTDRISQAATDLAAVIFSNLPMSSMALMEVEDQIAHRPSYQRYYQYQRRGFEKIQQRSELLTPTETELAHYLYKGLSPTEIAKVTGNTRTNVNSHLYNAYKKLGATGANSREVAVKRLFELNVFKDEEPIHAEPLTLTPRQKKVVGLLMEGVGRQETAELLGLRRGSIEREITKIKETLGVWNTHTLVRVVLEAGGLDAIDEPTPEEKEDKNELFLTGIETPKKYGMYVRWLEKIFLTNPEIPFSLEGLAKILYGEQYSRATRRTMVVRTYQLLNTGLNEGKKRIALRSNLAKAGLSYSRIDYPTQGNQSSIRYISHWADLQPVEFYMGKELPEAEIKELAIRLREEAAH